MKNKIKGIFYLMPITVLIVFCLFFSDQTYEGLLSIASILGGAALVAFTIEGLVSLLE